MSQRASGLSAAERMQRMRARRKAELVEALHEVAAESWREQAACRASDVDPAWFFPSKGEPGLPAKRVCAGCRVRVECLEAGMGERFGIWGGRTDRERHRVDPR